jgi:hypothetical protein
MFILKAILFFSLVNISMSGVVNSDGKSLPESVAKNSMSLMETGNKAGPGIVRSLNFYLQMKITIFTLVIQSLNSFLLLLLSVKGRVPSQS